MVGNSSLVASGASIEVNIRCFNVTSYVVFICLMMDTRQTGQVG